MSEPVQYELAELLEPVTVIRDRWGINHISAGNEYDLFFMQGYTAARDRLFQMDMWRRRGVGLLSEVWGESFIDHDVAARLFLYRGDMTAERTAYGPRVADIVTAFVDGVNCRIAQCLGEPDTLPVEFRRMEYLPGRWNVDDIFRIRAHGLYHNLVQEVIRARTLTRFGVEVENLRRVRTPGHHLEYDPALARVVSDDVLHTYRLATAPVSFGPERSQRPASNGGGSNNWVLGPSMTASGRPILANDPHRALTVPSLRYIVHLTAPGLDVIGAGDPWLPGISIGHNDRMAFGLTISALDQEDLYVYSGPENAQISTLVDEVPVRGHPAHVAELRFTRHGPLLHEDEATNSIFAVRAAWLEPGMAPYLAGAELMQARDPDTFLDALARWGTPGENQVYACVDGQIGWQMAGRIPIRSGWDGTTPISGEKSNEWTGFVTTSALPGVHNPPEDWVATANEMNLPDGWQDRIVLSHDWYADTRIRRIREVITADHSWTVEKALELQGDNLSLPARHIVPLLLAAAARTELDPVLVEPLNLLRQWDYRCNRESSATTIFEVWFRRFLRTSVLMHFMREHVHSSNWDEALASLIPDEQYSGDPRIDIGLISTLVDSDVEVLDGLMLDALRETVSWLSAHLGEDPPDWSWGRLHRVHLRHPLAALIDAPGLQLAPVARAGTGDTVCSTAYNDHYEQVSGASFRIVMDVGEWDGSVAVNAPGQSGDPTDPHFADHVDTWAEDRAFPLAYTQRAVECAAEAKQLFIPSPAPAHDNPSTKD